MSFEEYYEHYLTLHQNKYCRRMHVCGNLATIGYIGLICGAQMWWGLLLAPFVVYPFAWSGHFLFERNKPAAFSNPIWAKLSDWKMMKDILTGKLEW